VQIHIAFLRPQPVAFSAIRPGLGGISTNVRATANTADTPGQSGNAAAGSGLRHQTRACLADFEQNIRYSHDRARQSLDPTRDNNLGEAGADDRTTDQF